MLKINSGREHTLSSNLNMLISLFYLFILFSMPVTIKVTILSAALGLPVLQFLYFFISIPLRMPLIRVSGAQLMNRIK